MEDLSLHILDIAENSIRAGARHIDIKLIENKNTLILEIEDDGRGMDDKTVKQALNPFFTTKNAKNIGLGLSLLSQASEQTGGKLKIEKRADQGIRIQATFKSENIDMKPLGNIEKTLRVLVATHPEVRFSFDYLSGNGGSA